MRVSSLSFYNTTLAGIQGQQSSIARLSQQIASQQKYLAAKDSPIDTSRALQLADSISVRTQYQANQAKAEISQKEEQTVLAGLDTAISTARDVAMGTNAAADRSTRTQMAVQLTNLYSQIKDLANYKDSAGKYIFAGHQTDTQPFSHSSVYDGATAPQVTTYAGDAGIRRTEIDAGRYIQTNDVLTTVMQAGTANDLLQNIDQVAAALRDGTATQTDLSNLYTLLSSSMDSLRTIEAGVSGRVAQISETKSSTNSLLQNDRNALGQIKDLDTAQAIIELQQRQVSLQAAENAFSLTSKQSLFNYL